jgi:ABC-2 type transport system ATP-binding protein
MSEPTSTPAPGLVEIEDLTKIYGDFYAVKHLSLSVTYGQIFALLGPNGAGKTTIPG